jgi:hypothetical protein
VLSSISGVRFLEAKGIRWAYEIGVFRALLCNTLAIGTVLKIPRVQRAMGIKPGPKAMVLKLACPTRILRPSERSSQNANLSERTANLTLVRNRLTRYQSEPGIQGRLSWGATDAGRASTSRMRE